MHRSIRTLTLAALTALALAPATAALAHGEETQGDLSIVIGFGTEPAYAGLPNSAQVILVHDGVPVDDAKDLQVEVTFGDATETFDLEPAFGEPGDYRADFVPSEPGPYTFHVTGTVGDEDVDVEMTSGQDTFSEVQSIQEAAFPPVDAPSVEDLAGRLETETQRVDDALAQAAAANDEVSSAKTTAMIGVILGAIGVIAGIAGIVLGRRAAG
jgi:hypothetical protein